MSTVIAYLRENHGASHESEIAPICPFVAQVSQIRRSDQNFRRGQVG